MARVCVIGLGRIGLSLALTLANSKHRVYGFDTDQQIIPRLLNAHKMEENAVEEKAMVQRFLDKRLFVAKDLDEAISSSEVIFIAIGTGVSPEGKPELSNLYRLMDSICDDPAKVAGKLFILKSTLPIGTTRAFVALMEQKTRLVCGKDFFAAFCPERVLGDKALREMASLPKIIGGYDKVSSRKAVRIYKSIGGKIVVVESPDKAELIKLIDNAYRQTMFAFANDLALLAERHGMNAYDLVRKANDSYPRNNIPFPSGGVGGYCLTKDPLYLEQGFDEVASTRGFPSVWFMARKSNDYMPIHMVNLLKQALSMKDKKLCSSNILVCGIAYKENTDDIRCSHGLEIASRLSKEKANVFIWDPHVQEAKLPYKMIDNLETTLPTMDAMVFTVKHNEFITLRDNPHIMRMIKTMRTPIIIDGWGIFPKLFAMKSILYKSVGFPKALE